MSNESAYARAGVDIEAGERAVDLMKAHVSATRRPEAVSYTHLTLPTIYSV